MTQSIPLPTGEVLLVGHTSPETALTVTDYPYGFKLRCKIRYWLEYKKGRGYRLVSQTTDPKRDAPCPEIASGNCVDYVDGPCKVCGGTDRVYFWNKPKFTTYTPLAVMIQHPANAKGICAVTWTGVSIYKMADEMAAFVEKYGAALQDENALYVIGGFESAIQRRKATQ
jgi:hypothetical protein